MKKIILIISLIILTLSVVSCSSNNLSGDVTKDVSSKSSGSSSSLNSESVVSIPLDEISDELTKFEYDANGVIVKYFVVEGSDGEIRTAFDACDVCGGSKGYQQQGTDIVCKNCGKVFRIDGLGTKNKGYGCWPSYLSHTIEDGNVIIPVSELKAGAYRFQ